MKKETTSMLEILRLQAEDLLKDKQDSGANQKTGKLSEAEIMKLIHELEVQLIEIELQNEELLLANEKAANEAEKYAELFNLAPVAYLKLSKEGEILELNQSGADLLGKKKAQLTNSRFGFFVSDEGKPIFNQFLTEVFANFANASCELILQLDNSLPKFVQLTGNKDKKGNSCLLAMLDISKSKKNEEYLMATSRKLELALNSFKAGYWDWNVVSDQIEWSPQQFKLFGLDPKTTTASFETWRNLLHPEDVEIAGSRIAQALEEHCLLNSDYRVVMPDGEIRWVNAVGEGLYNEKGVAVQMIGICQDITERKLYEVKLLENEKKYRQLFQNLTAGFALHEIILNADGQACDYRFLEINPAFEKLTGLKSKDLIGKTNYEILPDSEPYWVETYGKVALTGQSISFENYSAMLKKHYQVTAYSPEPGKFATIFFDITDSKTAVEALKESEEKFRQLVWEMQVGVLLQGPQAEIILSNPRALELLGLTEDQLLGRTSLDPYWNVIHEDGSDFPGVDHPVPYAIAHRKSVRGVIMGVYRPSFGDRVWLLVDAVPQWNDDGSVRQVICTFIDISKRKKAEQSLSETNAFLENLINFASAPIIVWDPQFKISRFNHAFEVLCGRSEAEVLGQHLEILFPDHLIKKSMKLITEASSGERLENVEIEILHKNHSIRTLLWNSSSIFADDDKTAIATIAQGLDITDRKKAEEEIKTKNIDLQQMNAEKDKYFSIIAHDLRGPFNSFLGLTRVMAEELPDLTMDQIQKFAVGMRTSATNLYRLLENLLEWSKMQQDLIAVNMEVVYLLPIVDDSLEMMKEFAKEKQIEISIDISPSLKVYSDNNVLQTIFRNLISNAIKFTHIGGNIHILAASIPGKRVKISVKDSGIGMNAFIIENLFKLDVNTSRKGTEGELSSGLGLIICKDFIEKYGGEFMVESEVEKGSCFSFTLAEGN